MDSTYILPISWSEFKGLESEDQQEYISYLRSAYHANLTTLSKMFGTTWGALKTYLQHHGWNTASFRRGESMTSAERGAWEEFLNSGAEKHMRIVPISDEVEDVETTTEPIVIEDCAKDAEPTLKSSQMSLDEFTIHFSGKIDVGNIANTIQRMIESDACGEVTITCRVSA